MTVGLEVNSSEDSSQVTLFVYLTPNQKYLYTTVLVTERCLATNDNISEIAESLRW